PGRDTLAVAGTHGKTTTTTILAFLLEAAGREPGFLIGGVPDDFGVSARLGGGREFVVEADEYDTAFFDKRSKFVHYRPLVAVLNNLEFDHADIFDDLDAIKRQFHHFVRTVPRRGRLLVNGEDANLAAVLRMGCWTPVETFGVEGGDVVAMPRSRSRFASVKRRMELLGSHGGITVYDDFAHHPTAIATTLQGLRAKVGDARIVVAMEPRSNSMRLGAHADALGPSLALADLVVFLHRPELAWDAAKVVAALRGEGIATPDAGAL